MKRILLLTCCVFLVLLHSCAEIKNELRGTAKPDGGMNETVALSKTYAANYDKVWQSVRKVLDTQGYMYSADKSSGTIKTEPKYLSDPSKFRFIGSDYKAKLYVTVSGSTVTFKARFDKSSNLVESSQDREYPEKENQLRKVFFDELDQALGSGAVRASSEQEISSYEQKKKAPETVKETVPAVQQAREGEESISDKPVPKPKTAKVEKLTLKKKMLIVKIRPEANAKKPHIATLPGGTTVNKTGEEKDWFRIEFVDKKNVKRDGYIYKYDVEGYNRTD